MNSNKFREMPLAYAPAMHIYRVFVRALSRYATVQGRRAPPAVEKSRNGFVFDETE